MSDEVTTEFQAKMKSVAMEFLESRKVSGDMTTAMMFALLSLLKSKNKITDRDLDIIFEVEKESIAAALNEYFAYTHGDRNARIQNEEELKIVSRYAFAEIDNYRKQVADAASNLKTPRNKNAPKKTTGKKSTPSKQPESDS
jgi:hypothetical protein